MANFVQVVNNEVVGRYDLLPESWEGHDLKSISPADRKALGWYSVNVIEPKDWDGMVSRVTGPVFTINTDDVTETYTLESLSAEEIAANQAAAAEAAKVLAEMEKTQPQLPPVPQQ
jgi:hypothetical protein